MKILTLLLCLAGGTFALPPVKPTNCIEKCTCDEIFPNIVSVTKCNGPLTINSTLFSHLDRRIITVMSFSNVIINQIKEDAFKRLPNLDDVIIEKAQIGSIDHKAFNNVKRLKFADCNFEDNPNLTSEKLEELHFGNCNLGVIPRLDHLFSLKFLNLSGNFIKEIDIVTFAELFDLETLYLSNNEISRIPANVFVNNEELNSLFLDNNPLKNFYLNTSNKLETLSLKNCFLTSFDEKSSGRLQSLSELNLSNNRIRALSSDDLLNITQLTVIDLSNNSLTELDDDIFLNNPKLQKVILDGNRLESLPSFNLGNKGLFQIYTFSCKNCGLKEVDPSVFKNMPAIINLNLASNSLTSVRDTFIYITSLRILDISSNNITTLDGSFNKNRDLETLEVAGNPLGSLNPGAFINNGAIKKIDATNCKLQKLWSNNAVVLGSLRKLFIADNQLKNLTTSDFKVIPGLHALALQNNPLDYDDSVCKVFRLLEKRSVYLVEFEKQPQGPLSNDIDNFISSRWSAFQENKCKDINNFYNEEILEQDAKALEDYKDDATLLKGSDDKDADDDKDDDDDDYDEDDELSDDGTDPLQDAYDDYNNNGEKIVDDAEKPIEVFERNDINLARISYILSITSVFVLTALAVVIMVVVVTLCVLRRNNNFNVQRGNLPRIKIPRWDTQFTEKKHSGQIYRPLSEDLSGPKTPKMSRYEFSVAPTVHGNP